MVHTVTAHVLIAMFPGWPLDAQHTRTGHHCVEWPDGYSHSDGKLITSP